MTAFRETAIHRVVNRPVGDKCVLDLRFFDGTGTTVTDLSGYENHATLTLDSGQSQSDFWTPSRFGYAGNFNDLDYLTVSDAPSLELGDSFAIEFLITGDWQSFQWIAEKDGAFQIYNKNGNAIDADVDGIGDFAAGHGLHAGDIAHAVINYTGETYELWLNGARIEVSSASGSAATSANDLIISGRSAATDNSLIDKLHFFRIFRRPFGVEEIRGAASSPLQQGILRKKTAWWNESDTEEMAIDPDNNEVELSSGGARVYVNGSGEIVAEDEAGNTTTIS